MLILVIPTKAFPVYYHASKMGIVFPEICVCLVFYIPKYNTFKYIEMFCCC